MKNQISKIVLLAFLLVPLTIYSQVRFGVRGTVQRTNVSEIHGESVGRTAGSLGVLAQIPLGYDNQFFIQPEIVYSLQGEKDDNHWAQPAKYYQNYINIPVYFRAYFSEADSEFFGELGPQIGFLVSQKDKDIEKKYYGSNPKNFDVSIGAGIGYSINRKFEFGIRYNYGLIDIYPKYYAQERTSNLALAISYIFN